MARRIFLPPKEWKKLERSANKRGLTVQEAVRSCRLGCKESSGGERVMNDRSEGMIDGLGIAILLAQRHKNAKQLLAALTEATQQVQLIRADTTLDNIEFEGRYRDRAKSK
ncbi:MAG: hypothetical protein ACLP9D_03525 [Candidatus Bathyarchaeia archaeon]